MLRILIVLLVSSFIFGSGYYIGSQITQNKVMKEHIEAVNQVLIKERAKQDEKDKKLAEANILISQLRSLNERVQCSTDKPSKDLQSCNRERLRLRNLAKRCSSVVTRYIEGTDKLIIESQ